MTVAAWIMLLVAGGFAITDWVAVVRADKRLEYLAKPATLVALIGVALLLEPFDPTVRGWWLAALVASLAGDVFLMLRRRLFVAGLASFLVAHVAYIMGFLSAPVDERVLGLFPWPSLIVVAAGVLFGGRLVRAVLDGPGPGLAIPVVAYMAAISGMLLMAVVTGSPWAIGGAALFYVSDLLIGWNRFVRSLAWAPLCIIVTYHLAQAALVVFLARG